MGLGPLNRNGYFLLSKPVIVVFEKTSSYCGMCVATKKKLDLLGFDYEVKAIEDQPAEWLHAHKTAGRLQAPIVEIAYPDSGGSIEWGGYRVDILNELEKK